MDKQVAREKSADGQVIADDFDGAAADGEHYAAAAETGDAADALEVAAEAGDDGEGAEGIGARRRQDVLQKFHTLIYASAAIYMRRRARLR